MAIKPIGERVLIKHTKQAEKTKGGIYIPDEAKKEKKQGEVIAVGTYKDGTSLPIKAGDIVLYGGYSNETVEMDGEDLVMVEFKDILARIE